MAAFGLSRDTPMAALWGAAGRLVAGAPKAALERGSRRPVDLVEHTLETFDYV